MKSLEQLLLQNHGINKNGCYSTDYSKIPNFTILSSTTNGTSGIGVWRRQKVYFYYCYAQKRFIAEAMR